MQQKEVAIFSSACTRVEGLGFEKHIFFSAVERESKRNILLKINHFNPYILLLPDQLEFKQLGGLGYVQSAVQALNDLRNDKGHFLLSINEVDILQSTPCMQFSDNAMHQLIKLSFAHDGDRSRAREYFLQKRKMLDLNIIHIVHDKVDTVHQFMMEHNIRFQSWCNVPLSPSSMLMEGIATCPIYDISALSNQLQPSSTNKSKVMLSVMFVVLFAKSSQATKLSSCNAHAQNAGDQITHIAIQVDQQDPEILLRDSERNLLLAFLERVRNAQVQMIIYCSDQNISPVSPLEYMTERAALLNLPEFNLSVFFHCHPKTKVSKRGKHDQVIFGLERADVRTFLHKMRAKPLLTGYTLLDVVRHPNLVKKKPMFAPLEDLNYQSPTSLTSTEDQISNDLAIRLAILVSITFEKGFIPNILASSNQNDLHIREVVECGEQRKITNVMMRHFDKHHWYIDETTLVKNSLMIAMPEQKSSFPSPQWLENPDISSFIPPDERAEKSKTTTFLASTGKTLPKKPTNAPKKNPLLGGGLVLTPESGFYSHVRHLVKTLDWVPFISLFFVLPFFLAIHVPEHYLGLQCMPQSMYI